MSRTDPNISRTVRRIFFVVSYCTVVAYIRVFPKVYVEHYQSIASNSKRIVYWIGKTSTNIFKSARKIYYIVFHVIWPQYIPESDTPLRIRIEEYEENIKKRLVDNV